MSGSDVLADQFSINSTIKKRSTTIRNLSLFLFRKVSYYIQKKAWSNFNRITDMNWECDLFVKKFLSNAMRSFKGMKIIHTKKHSLENSVKPFSK